MANASYRHVNLFLIKPGIIVQNFEELLKEDNEVNHFELDPKWDLDGALYVKRPIERKPKWSEILDEITGIEVPHIATKSSSAVLFLKTKGNTFVFTFGYGRYLIDTAHCVQDFGIKTALNTLDHRSLRSVDLHTLEDQPVQKKAQSTRESEVSIFGIDISRDVLRAVTGSPKKGIRLKNISGGDAMFSFGVDLRIEELSELAELIEKYYSNDDYKSEFGWVDNVKRVKDKSIIDILDQDLLMLLKAKNSELVFTLPEIGNWDSITGFSFTRSKTNVLPIIEAKNYFEHTDLPNITIESIKRDRLFVHDIYDQEIEHSIYKCLYAEMPQATKTNIFFCGMWYQIDNQFINRVNTVLNLIEISDLVFPPVETWSEDGENKIEAEGDYNIKFAESSGYYLLDKKLIKSTKATTTIELCDVLTPNKQFIHVKHRKGGSAGLSHLFAQGSVAAEIMLGDKEFRKAARNVLGKIGNAARELVPLDKLKSSDCEIVFLILGDKPSHVKENLPFFSKVNLSRAYENLSQRGFAVKISAAITTAKIIK
jgi:uncharacterized protein (TIGR04141 family)